MSTSEFAFGTAMIGLGYVALQATRLSWAAWHGRSPHFSRASVALGAAVIAGSFIPLPSSGEEPILVAAVTSSVPPARENGPSPDVAVSGNYVRVTGNAADGASNAIWAVIEDPRTGALWLQGPAVPDGSSWTLGLMLGANSTESGPLLYRVNVARVDMDVHEAWLTASQLGILSVSTLPTARGWLARDRAVHVGG